MEHRRCIKHYINNFFHVKEKPQCLQATHYITGIEIHCEYISIVYIFILELIQVTCILVHFKYLPLSLMFCSFNICLNGFSFLVRTNSVILHKYENSPFLENYHPLSIQTLPFPCCLCSLLLGLLSSCSITQ